MKDKTYDLCVVGAGFAGLNALYTALRYFRKGAQVLLIDKNNGVGGMWRGTYSYVRLHQPYEYFTFDNLKWDLGVERGHLASRSEILSHFERAMREIREKFNLECFFDCTYRGYQPFRGGVYIDLESGGESRRVRTRMLVNAVGADIEQKKPLVFSSKRVRSIVPDEIDSITSNTGKPISFYLLGSGKTGMDCAYNLFSQDHGFSKRVTLIAGRGTLFRLRDDLFPRSFCKRLVSGRILSDSVFDDFIKPWNGDNTAEVLKRLRDEKKLVSLVRDSENYQNGIISTRELRAVERGLGGRIIKGHVEDIIDDNHHRPVMVLRDGARLEVNEKAVFVNCTSNLITKEMRLEPVLSECGRVLTTSFFLGLSGSSACFLSHAFFLGRLAEVSKGLHILRPDGEPKNEVPFRIFLGSLANALLLAEVIPVSILLSNRMNMTLWYPWYRRLISGGRLMLNKKYVLQKADRLLRDK